MFSSKVCDDFAIHYSFKVKCVKNLYWDVSSGMLLTLKVGGGFRCEHCSFQLWVQQCCGLCKYIVWHTEISIFRCIYLNFQKLCAKIQSFQRTLQAKLNTLKESCTFKGKCAVNAENFICDLQTGPLKKIIFEGRRTILKERAFQQCIATQGLVFVRQSL